MAIEYTVLQKQALAQCRHTHPNWLWETVSSSTLSVPRARREGEHTASVTGTRVAIARRANKVCGVWGGQASVKGKECEVLRPNNSVFLIRVGDKTALT